MHLSDVCRCVVVVIMEWSSLSVGKFWVVSVIVLVLWWFKWLHLLWFYFSGIWCGVDFVMRKVPSFQLVSSVCCMSLCCCDDGTTSSSTGLLCVLYEVVLVMWWWNDFLFNWCPLCVVCRCVVVMMELPPLQLMSFVCCISLFRDQNTCCDSCFNWCTASSIRSSSVNKLLLLIRLG